MRPVWSVLALLVAAVASAADVPTSPPPRAHVYLVVVDGLDPRFLDPDATPALFAGGRVPGRAVAVMPTRTNPNHVSLLTGTWPDVHGITGNAWWDRDPAHAGAKLDDPARVDVETLFTVAETDAPTLVTYGVFSKPKLGRLLAAVPGRQRAPDELWSPSGDGPGIDPVTHYADDTTTMDRLLALVRAREPDLAVVNISDVDRCAHGWGPASAEAARAVKGADAAIARLVDVLHEAGRWERSVVVVTADHGFDDVAPTPERPNPAIDLAAVLAAHDVHDVRVVADGGVAHVYGVGVAADAPSVGRAVRPLAQAAAVARGTRGVAEVLARLAVPGVDTLAQRHPDWHVDHPRSGELLVVAALHHQLVDAGEPRLRGNHGGPAERAVPLVDLGRHVAELLGLRPGRVLGANDRQAALTGRTAGSSTRIRAARSP